MIVDFDKLLLDDWLLSLLLLLEDESFEILRDFKVELEAILLFLK